MIPPEWLEQWAEFNRDMRPHRRLQAGLVVADSLIWLAVIVLVVVLVRH